MVYKWDMPLLKKKKKKWNMSCIMHRLVSTVEPVNSTIKLKEICHGISSKKKKELWCGLNEICVYMM